MLTLILVESALETIPKKIWSHSAVRRHSKKMKKPSKQLLLDRSLHHSAMKNLMNAHKRGRPDITHFTLLEALSSPLNKEGLLKIIIHTNQNYIITVNPKRPERVYLGTSAGVYKSINNGQSWGKMKNGLPKSLRVFDIKIVRMPDNKDVVYAAGSNGVFMTTDDDNTLWVNKSYGLEKTAITSIVLLPN